MATPVSNGHWILFFHVWHTVQRTSFIKNGLTVPFTFKFSNIPSVYLPDTASCVGKPRSGVHHKTSPDKRLEEMKDRLNTMKTKENKINRSGVPCIYGAARNHVVNNPAP